MKSSFYIILFTLFAAGLIVGNISSSFINIGNNGAKLSEEIVGNPTVTNITLEGKVIDIDGNSLVLERDGKKIKVYFGDKSTFAKMAKLDDPVKPTSLTEISKLPVGSEVLGGGVIKEDPKAGEFKIYTTLFYIK